MNIFPCLYIGLNKTICPIECPIGRRHREVRSWIARLENHKAVVLNPGRWCVIIIIMIIIISIITIAIIIIMVPRARKENTLCGSQEKVLQPELSSFSSSSSSASSSVTDLDKACARQPHMERATKLRRRNARRRAQLQCSGDRLDICVVDGNAKLYRRTCGQPFAEVLSYPNIGKYLLRGCSRSPHGAETLCSVRAAQRDTQAEHFEAAGFATEFWLLRLLLHTLQGYYNSLTRCYNLL